MRPQLPLKEIIIAFVVALVLYIIFYGGIESRRHRNGPWNVWFTNEAGIPALVINEPKLNIAKVKITFPGQNAPVAGSLPEFAQPQDTPFVVPFGQCVFEDLTFLPGTVVLKVYGHEIQLLPRVLTIDKKEYPWQSNFTLPLAPIQ